MSKSRRCWLVLGCVFILAFFMWGTLLCIPPLLLIIKEELSLSYAQAGFLYAAPFVTYILLAMPGGYLADRIGFRRATGMGAVVAGVGSLLRGASWDFPTLLTFTFIMGAGFGLSVPSLPKLIGKWFPPSLTGTATGIYVGGLGIGSVVASGITIPIVIPILHTWQGALYFWGILIFVPVVLWWVFVREPPSSDTLGDNTRNHSMEKDGQESFHSIWKNRNVWLIALMFMMSLAVFYALTGWVPALLEEKGVTRSIATLMLAVMLVAGILPTFIAPLASDRVGLRKPFLWLSWLVIAVICPLLAYFPVDFSFWILIVVGVFIAIPLTLVFVLPIELVPPRLVGGASGIMISVGYIGAIWGPWLTGYLKDLTGGFAYAMLMLAAASVVALFLSLALPETGRKSPSRRLAPPKRYE